MSQTIQLFPYDIYHDFAQVKTYRVRIQPEEDADPSTVTVRSDFTLADLIWHIKRQDCAVLAIRRTGAWHNLERAA